MIFGPDYLFSLEHRCFNGICFILAIVFLLSTVANWLVGLQIEMIVSVFILGLLFYLCFYLARYRGIFFPLYWIVFVFGCLFVNLVWFYSGGVSGTATLIALNIAAVVSLIFSGRRLLISILGLSVNLFVLYCIEYLNPDAVMPYQTDLALFVDVYFTYSVAVIIICFVIYFSITHFREERKKVLDREEKLRAILDNIPDSVWLKDDQARFTMVNRPFSENCGTEVEKIIGSTVFDIWPDEMAKRFEKDDDLILQTGRSLRREEVLSSGQPVEARFEICKTPIMDSDGRVVGIVGIARDITARYEYEDRLKKYRRIVDTSIDQMALINKDYRYEAANTSYLEAHGIKEDTLVGSFVSTVHDAQVFRRNIAPRLKAAFQGEVVNYQDISHHPKEGLRYEEVAYFPHKDADGKTVSVVSHIKDVTEKKQMEQRLARSEKMEAIGTLAGGIAHDFNNILSGILGYAQLGKLNLDDTTKVNRHLDQIIKGSERAGDLIRQILTFSRQYEYEPKPLKTAIIVKEALKLIRASVPTYIEIKEHIESEKYIFADPSQIHQVVMNLCTNAYQSITGTQGVLTIRLTDRVLTSGRKNNPEEIVPGKYQCIEVADTGSGMDAQTLKKIFNPYFTTKEMDKGTGLGLALVHGIVEELNGFIKVDSTLGKGSVFRLYLPVMDDAAAQKQGDPVQLNEYARGVGRIMLVDDETSILYSSKELLEDCGYTVTPFVNGRLALDEFAANPDDYDLVITDMTMPKMTGDVMAQQMLAIRPELPVALCTGYSDRISESSALEMGIDKFFQKPVNSRELTAYIKQTLAPQG